MRTKILTESADKPAMIRHSKGRRDEKKLWLLGCSLFLATWLRAPLAAAQVAATDDGSAMTERIVAGAPSGRLSPARVASQRFIHSRLPSPATVGSAGLATARAQHAMLVHAQATLPPLSTLNASWTAVGPAQIASLAYGNVSGRVSAIAIDPADRTGNTVYLGTTGGGVWKSGNAAGPAAAVSFQPLTDNLPVFSGNAGTSVTASISIGAISAQAGGIVLAGTGDPNDASDSYYGSGLLRSTDSGLTWTLTQYSQDGSMGQHSFIGLGFAGFAWSTVNSSLVVAALSQSVEGTIVSAPGKNSVMGLYASSDAGLTWRMATISDGMQTIQTPQLAGGNQGGLAVTSVAWNPVRQRFYAAVRYHGYYESQDGMAWTRLAAQPGTAMSVSNCPAAPGTSGSITCPVFRGAITVQPVTGDMFALTTDRNNVDQGLWQDICATSAGNCSSGPVTFGKRLASTALEASGSAVIPQADYNLSLAAVPVANDTILFAGTGDLYRCALGAGCLLRNTTNATNACAAPAKVAPSQHAIAVSPTSSSLFLGNDSGLWRSNDNVNQAGPPCSPDDASHFDNLNGSLGSLAEVVSFAQDPDDASILLAGLGASGTVSSAAFAGAWQQISAAEGGTVAIDQNNPLLWYISTAGGVSIHGCSSGANCSAADFAGLPTIGPVQTGADASVLDPPWILDPARSANIIIGTCRAWRGPAGSGSSWPGVNQLSATLGGPPNSTCDPATNPLVRSLAAAGPSVAAGTPRNSGSKVLYAGMAGSLDGGGAFGGHLFATYSADTASSATRWQDLAVSPVLNDAINSGHFNPGGFDISSLAADPHDATGGTIYATVMGFTGSTISTPHVYGSTDSGAHWLNLSSNLPNAPANSVVVDPNDANTLYVAMDTGVYVTTQISSCPTSNCWSVYGISLPNSPVIQISAAGRMATGDGRAGMLRAATYGRGIWQIPLLTAATAAQPAITLSPASLSFSSQAVGTASATQTIQVTNTGSAAMMISRSVPAGDFRTGVDTCMGISIAASASCSIQVQFVPAAQGTRSGLLTVYANVSGGQATAVLTGDATPQGDLILTPLSLSFPSTTVNAASAPQNITISNLGQVSKVLPAPGISGDFLLSANTCGASLAPGTGCTVSVVFAPTTAGPRTGSLQVAGSAGTLTASLVGNAVAPATDALSTSALSFGTQQLGTASPSQAIILTNAGDVPLTLISAQIGTGDFTAVNGCGNSLNAHSTCSIQVAYAPRSIGAGSGTLVVSDQFRSQTINLNGIGIAPPGVSLSPSGTMTFPATPVGTQSALQAVTLTNNGGLPLTIQNVSLTGDFVLVAGGTCGADLAPSTACTLYVAFAPSTGGSKTGSIVVADNAPASPQTLALTGAGVDFTLSPDGSTSATVANGKTATYPLLLNSAAGMSGTAAFSCTGAPANATCVVSPGSAALGSTTLITVTVSTGVAPTTVQNASNRAPQNVAPALVVAGLLPFGALFLRRRRLASLMGTLAVLCIFAGGGCGAGREIPLSGNGISVPGALTPSGNYKLTIAATSSGLTRTTDLALTVQ